MFPECLSVTNAITNIMISAWEKPGCLHVVVNASKMKNNFSII